MKKLYLSILTRFLFVFVIELRGLDEANLACYSACIDSYLYVI
jgi:hypothetical protein